jgi:hypothetical protein
MIFRKLIGHIHDFISSVMQRGPMPSRPAVSFGMKKTAVGVVACVLIGAASLCAQGEQVFKGMVCLGPEGRTPIVKDGQSMLPCTVKHPKMGSKYVLFNSDTKISYKVDGHPKPKAFAGHDVVIIGTLDPATGTIHIDDMFTALPQKLVQATSVYIDCDACPRGMSAAWQAAFDELEDWKRFDITPDPKKADVIFVFAANPYLGDYVTRDGPDKRPVNIRITYMNAVDPKTGENLWGDSRDWGSLFVARATRDLIKELKSRLEQESQTDAQSLAARHHASKTLPKTSN